MDFDVAVVGAGPAGLSAALALSAAGWRVGVVERAGRDVLAAPAVDGREIALAHHAVGVLKRLGVWERIPGGEVSPLVEARVQNGRSPLALRFAAPARLGEPLGWFVPNHLIRRALFEAVAETGVELLDGVSVGEIATGDEAARLSLADGRAVTARLVVAADTRFSEIRRRQGIGARMLDFGKTMLVSRMAHEKPHGGVACEWFGHGITIATLPLPGDASGVVVTLSGHEVERLKGLSPEAFALEMEGHLGARLGKLELVGERHAWPLVATYAHRFVGRRLALVGDAAVGMHPVTAHGFNFGVKGADRLAASLSGDPGAAAGLAKYERGHRADTLPLWLATNAIARLYTDERLPARIAREALIGLGAAAVPVRRMIAARLVDSGGGRRIPFAA